MACQQDCGEDWWEEQPNIFFLLATILKYTQISFVEEDCIREAMKENP